MVYVDFMGEYNAETTTFTALSGTDITAGKYSPLKEGMLKRIRLILGRDGATSLINHVQIRAKCVTFGGVDVTVGITGGGLATAPAVQPPSEEFAVDLPVKPGSSISLEGRNVTADTPVGVSCLVFGIFE